LVNTPKPIVALFGGSFDPPHLGHQEVIRVVYEKISVDKIIVVPTYLNPFKTHSFASPKQRLQWCHTLFDSLPYVEVDDFEIEEGKTTFTSETVKYFNKVYHVAYLVIGADNLEKLTKWHQFEWLNQHITWVILERQEPIDAKNLSPLRAYHILSFEMPMSSSYIRKHHALHFIDSKIKHSVHTVLKGNTMKELNQRVQEIVHILDEKKADEIEVFNLEDADYIAQRVILANSMNGKHTLALYDYLKKALKEKEESFLVADTSDEWVVADLGDILIHIMIPQYRQRYNLEAFLSELITQKEQ